MADFRKWFLAFAVLALLSGFAVPASAQIVPALQCTFNAAATPTVRAEGLAEYVGDIVLNCTGGTPTLPNAVVPAANITIFLNTNVTSRITSNPFVETVLLIDEPHSATNPTRPITMCDPTNVAAGICSAYGVPLGTSPAGTYDPAVGGNNNGAGVNGGNTGTRVNAFQARLTGANQVTFFGVPIDPPGTTTNRIIRITNIRANANQLGVSSTLIPTQVTANISVNPFNLLPLNNPQQTLAFIARGLTSSVRFPFTFVQCNDANGALARGSSSSLSSGGQNGQQFSVRFDEGFASSWKEKNIQTHLSNSAGGRLSYTYPADASQDVPGANYWSESGLELNGTSPSPLTPPVGFGPFLTANSTATWATRGLQLAGVASQGTRLMMAFNSVPNGSQIWVPTSVNITTPITGATSGFAVLVSTDANGAGGFSAASGNSSALSQVSLFNGSGIAVYEVLYDDPFNLERLEIPVAVAFSANPGNNLPAPGVQSTLTGSFAPLSNVGTASDSAPHPRFAPSATPLNDFIIVKCSCNLLFPFVTNQQGFDTGVAISNTSVDPFGTTPQNGTVTLNYYSGGTPPPPQTTNAVVPAGQQVLFTLSGGGNFGIAATPGFQGYIIAQSQFQFCHAFAYVSAQGALPTAPGASEGYLGIVMDSPGLYRTGQIGENLAH